MTTFITLITMNSIIDHQSATYHLLTILGHHSL